MRAVIGLIVITALVLGAAWWIDHLNGAVHLTLGSLVVDTPISVAVVALLAFALVLYLVFRLLAAVFGLRHVLRRSGSRANQRRGEAAVTSVLVALAAREAGEARSQAARARRYLGDTPQTLLLSAYAGSIAGEEEEATEAFEKLAARKDAAFLGLRGLLTQAMAAGDWARANELAKQAERAHPGAAWIRAERTHLAVRTGDWQEALLLNRNAPPHAALAAAAADAESDPVRATKLAKDAFKRDPGLTPAALAYARRLREGGREKNAQDVLRQAWTRAPHPELAELALAATPDRLERLRLGHALVRDIPENAESHVLLGRLALEAGQAGEAQRHAEAAERAGLAQRRVFTLLADAAEAAGQDDVYREALRRASTADADPAWVCEACGVSHTTWHPACPNCHATGRIRWGHQVAAVALPAPAAQ
jgi:HemY protein